ncbi:MAG: hypothetical protein JST39_20740, partial [Bacteroidetes bacterium]|nr:hypothetical protein [Bacteroidota bacterium]
SDRKRNMEEVYGKFYFTDFYTGTEGLSLFQINPRYLEKYPVDVAKPSLIKVMYRFKPNYPFLIGVNESFISKIDLNEFRKLIE